MPDIHSQRKITYNIDVAAPHHNVLDMCGKSGRQQMIAIAGTLGARRSHLELTIKVFGLSSGRLRRAMAVIVKITIESDPEADQRARLVKRDVSSRLSVSLSNFASAESILEVETKSFSTTNNTEAARSRSVAKRTTWKLSHIGS
jgi:hypothetical protein